MVSGTPAERSVSNDLSVSLSVASLLPARICALALSNFARSTRSPALYGPSPWSVTTMSGTPTAPRMAHGARGQQNDSPLTSVARRGATGARIANQDAQRTKELRNDRKKLQFPFTFRASAKRKRNSD